MTFDKSEDFANGYRETLSLCSPSRLRSPSEASIHPSRLLLSAPEFGVDRQTEGLIDRSQGPMGKARRRLGNLPALLLPADLSGA